MRLGISYPECNLLEIAQNAGIAVHEVDLTQIRSGLSGIVEYDDDIKKTNPRIFIHAAMPDERKRFTLAHELGHHFLHVGKKLRLDGLDYSSENTKEETEANYFAATLLVPRDLLLQRISKGDNVTQLAQYFQVSRPVIENRIKWVRSNS
jgi:Zn-dependent peptidase ImmA (M78 family)